MKKLLFALGLILAPSLAFGQCTGIFPANTVCGNPGPTADFPRPSSITAYGDSVPVPKWSRYQAISTNFTPDPSATILEVWMIGGGGGGSGNTATNKIPYGQYGRIGTPSAFGRRQSQVTFTAASPTVITWPGHGLACNDPVYFASSGSMPSPLVANTIYYVMCDGSLTSDTFQISTTLFQAPLTCAVYPPFCQSALGTSDSGSGTLSGYSYYYVALPGSGGGVIGDEAVPGTYIRCDSAGPAGYQQGVGIGGATGLNPYGIYVRGSMGGNGPFGGGGTGASHGTNSTGGGGAGANPTKTSSGGGGGGSGGWCHFTWKPTGGSIPILAGTGGAGGLSQTAEVSISIASPAVIGLSSHSFGPNAEIKFYTSGSLPAGLTPDTTYYVLGSSITTNTFQVSSSINGSAINTSGTQSGTQFLQSGGPGGAGGNGMILIKQSYGLE